MEAYQVRYLKEYQELCKRYGKLLKMLRDIDLGIIDFKLKYENVGLEHYNFNIMYGDEYGKY